MGRSLFTHITPIPPGISRDTAITRLHDHVAMIQLNPLVIRQEATDAPPDATKDEAELGTWYSITDLISYLPGGLYKGEVSYKACFYNLQNGLQTHVFAPAGVDIRSKWSIGGNMPGEPRESSELGVDKPREGLYIKEEIDLRCNMFMGAFVKRNLQTSHQEVHDKIIKKATELEMRLQSALGSVSSSSSNGAPTTESIVNSNNNHLVSRLPPPPPPLASFSGRVSPPADTLRSSNSQSRELDYTCTCPGTSHSSHCFFFHPGDLQHEQHQHDTRQRFAQQEQQQQQPSNSYPTISLLPASTSSSLSGPSSAAAPSPATHTHAPSELQGSPAQGQCLCTGGLHDRTCTFYPGLRLPVASSSSSSSSFSSPKQISSQVPSLSVQAATATASPRESRSPPPPQSGDQAEWSATTTRSAPVAGTLHNFSRPRSSVSATSGAAAVVRPGVSQRQMSDRM